MRFTQAMAMLMATLSSSATRASGFALPRSRPALLASAAILPSWIRTVRGGSTARNAATEAAVADTANTASQNGETAAAAAATYHKSYDELVNILQGITHLSNVEAVLGYDQMVFMPQTDDAASERGKQSAALAAVIHEKSIDPKIGDLLAEIEAQQDGSSSDDHRRVVELARKAYDKKVKIPTSLASQRASLSSEAYNVWAKARAADDFSQFEDILGQGIAVAKETTAKIQTEEDKQAGKSLYATMLDDFEVGMDPVRIDSIFQEIQDALVPLIAKVLGDDATAPNTDPLQGNFPIDQQEALSKQLVRAIGFDDTRGRIDVSVHPFSSGISKHDVRITSRFRTDEWYQGLAGSMHEGGHAMYEQNVGGSGLPIDSALSMGMHESQSLFWERHVGLSKPFWKYATPIVQEHLGLSNTEEELYAAVNAAKRSLIRVEADELTYPLHVILRYNIERDFVEGRLEVKDIPNKWNEGLKAFLNVDVPSDAQGCLQDVHWSMLVYGYFRK
jgi:carboxypeptidase Taq